MIDRGVRALVVDPKTPSTLYAGTYKGVFKSTDSGENWSVASTGLTPENNVDALVIDHITPSTLYGADQMGLFKSTNAGQD